MHFYKLSIGLTLKTTGLIVAICFFFLPILTAQKIIGLEAKYVNTFREWIITTEDETIHGELWMRWPYQNDWTEWDLRMGDVMASFKQKWKEDPNLWEIQCNGVTVNARTAWNGEFYRWKLTDGKHQFTWRSEYANDLDEWIIDDNGSFEVHTFWGGDPRAWVIKDELPEDVSLAMRLAMIFLAVHFSSPRI